MPISPLASYEGILFHWRDYYARRRGRTAASRPKHLAEQSDENDIFPMALTAWEEHSST